MATNETKSLINEIATRVNSYNDYYYNQFIKWLPNPDVVLSKANKTIAVYKELLADPFIHGCMESRKAGVLSLEWDIDKGKTKSKQARFLTTVLNNLNIYKIINNVLDAVGYGYSVHEIIWQNVNGYWIPVDVRQKPAEWFQFSPDNELLFRSKNNYYGETVPKNKFLVATNNGSYANPYGVSILSKCFWPATFKKGGLKFWVTYTEKFGNPWIIAKVPLVFSQNQIDEVVDIFNNMIQDGVAVVKENVDVNINGQSNTASILIFERLIQYCKDDISMAFLGHTKAGQSVPGELGNKTQQLDVRSDIIMSDKRIVEEFFNELIKIVFSLNFDSSTEIPRFVLYEENNEIDLDLANRDKTLKELGLSFTKDYIKRAYYLNDEDFDINEIPVSLPVVNNLNEPIKQSDITDAVNNEFEAKSMPGQGIIDVVAEKVLEESKKMLEGLTKPVLDYVNNSGTFEEALDGLAEIYPQLNTDELYNKLVSIMFAAELIGRLEVRSELGMKQ
jgi:phage gp29-like protein